jgi:serine/threonine-protein kinase SRPK3
MLGHPPVDLLERGLRSKEFFDEEGPRTTNLPSHLVSYLTVLPGSWIADKMFLEFVRCMLQWKPEDRMTAKQLLEHPWLKV